MLREKLRSLASQNTQKSYYTQRNKHHEDQQVAEEDETGSTEDNENLEFHVNEDMLNFLEQSMKHKIELKKKRDAELSAEQEEERNKDECIQGGAAWVQARNTNAKLLYGEASATILAMETALQTTVDRHKDKAKPQLWPIIPLKP
nr:gem-associated protein 8-like [Nomia melanderi]